MEAITRSSFGRLGTVDVDAYTLANRRGSWLKLTNYGATLVELHVPDRHGQLADIVLGCSDLDAYVSHDKFFGATVGRVANRIRNGTFELDGVRYQLERNNGPHHLHGGRRGWDRAVWDAQAQVTEAGPSVELARVSPHGEEGYPGEVRAGVRYTWTHQDELLIDMWATTDRTTIVNMAHHSYWNLGGHGSGDVLGHELALHADFYTPGDPVVPTGELAPVAGTPFDFRHAKAIGRDLAGAGGDPAGFDHNWVVSGRPGELRAVARLRDPVSGRHMSLDSDAPGVQFYSGNFLDGALIGKGQRYGRHAGLCLETQAFPNSINVPEWMGQVILEAGQRYEHRMVHRFTAW